MRYQEPIYIQLPINCVRNKVINLVSTSSDICVFSEPIFSFNGGIKIPSPNIVTDNMCSIDLNTMFNNACSKELTYVTASTWNLNVFENGGFVYSANVLTSISSANTLNYTASTIYTAITQASTILGYNININTGTCVASILQPYGITDIEFDLCLILSYNILGAGGGVCPEYCEVLGYFDFSGITSGSTGIYNVTTATTIGVSFNFTGNTDEFGADGQFNYSVYKYDNAAGIFTTPPLYSSQEFNYSAFSGTTLVDTIPIAALNIDGEYLIKGYYLVDACTEYMGFLGNKLDTSNYIQGPEYGLYNVYDDYYFVAVRPADVPMFSNRGISVPIGQLRGVSIFPEFSGQSAFTISSTFQQNPIVCLNGLVLANSYDYAYIGNILTISAITLTSDVITVIGVTVGSSAGLVSEQSIINGPIVSGATGNQNGYSYYFDTTTNKYEIYTDTIPMNNSNVIVTLNGMVLAPNIDYYQSISNSKRFILEGVLTIGDVINVFYNSSAANIGSVFSNQLNINWTIANAPQAVNGIFTVEVSTGDTFTTLLTTATVDYVVGQSSYSALVYISGTIGTNIYYRIYNYKDYITLSGGNIITDAYSDTITLTINNNAINSY